MFLLNIDNPYIDMLKSQPLSNWNHDHPIFPKTEILPSLVNGHFVSNCMQYTLKHENLLYVNPMMVKRHVLSGALGFPHCVGYLCCYDNPNTCPSRDYQIVSFCGWVQGIPPVFHHQGDLQVMNSCVKGNRNR